MAEKLASLKKKGGSGNITDFEYKSDITISANSYVDISTPSKVKAVGGRFVERGTSYSYAILGNGDIYYDNTSAGKTATITNNNIRIPSLSGSQSETFYIYLFY